MGTLRPHSALRATLVTVVAVSVAVPLLTACGSDAPDATGAAASTTTEAPGSGMTAPVGGFGQAAGLNCSPLPAHGHAPLAWLPADLPLPSGSYAVDEQADSGGYHRGTLAVPRALHDLVREILAQWPAKGWRMGRGDAEAGEAEDSFARGDESGGFRARSSYCQTDWTEFYLVLKVPGAKGSGPVPGADPDKR